MVKSKYFKSKKLKGKGFVASATRRSLRFGVDSTLRHQTLKLKPQTIELYACNRF